jgi:hypothetical protein
MEPPVTITLNSTAARLLVHLAQEMGTNDPSAVVRQALGLLDMAQRMKRGGGRLFFRNAQGHEAEVAY